MPRRFDRPFLPAALAWLLCLLVFLAVLAVGEWLFG